MAPPKKPADRRQRRNDSDVGLVLVDARHDCPPPPPGLLKVNREDWATYWSSEVASLCKPEHVAALRRLFILRDASARAWREEGRRPFIEGAAGQPRANPAGAKRALELEGAIQKLEDKFGKTPLAQLKLGVTFQRGKSLTEMNRRLMEGDRDDDVHEPDPRAIGAG